MSPPGGLVGTKRWLVPGTTTEPGKLMRLGSILREPYNPESSLNRRHILEIDEEDTYNESEVPRRLVQNELHRSNNYIAKIASSIPLIRAGFSVKGHSSQDPKTTVEMMNIRAKSFTPSDEYMEEALKHPQVVKYTQETHFRKRLYMIVGVATANKVTFNEIQSTKAGMSASAKAGAPQAADIEIGASHSSEVRFKAEWEVEEECDFAYRVREVKYSKSRFHDKDYTKGALFGADHQVNSGNGDLNDIVPQFERLNKDDAVAEELISGIFVLSE
ncbi:hypothetical protein N7493_001637 [Penicillium malachiteum]|uniref:Uncharacterized protein n=1 Tax=Penicillium malachiteum TaxID=1324776 RepID=A0AAD6N007_9EURO|nr:hypothetical protein N7493_001637 [Penicillium malachiteum]